MENEIFVVVTLKGSQMEECKDDGDPDCDCHSGD